MRIQYVLNEKEVNAAKKRLDKLRWIALMSRDSNDEEGNREFYLRAKGFEDALMILGILEDKR